MFALPLGILCAAGLGLLFIAIAIAWRAASLIYATWWRRPAKA